MREQYDAIMNENKNPLQRLPKSQQFQIMTFLSMMWTTVFCVAFSAWAWWGEILIGHVAVALAVVVTGLTFRSAKNRSHRDLYQRQDGTARYDDLWGG